MMRHLIISLLLNASFLSHALASEAVKDVTDVLIQQQHAWNRGDIPAFMNGYWQSDQLRFASGNSITYGWQPTLRRYQERYQNKALMGSLKFDIRDVQKLSDKHAVVFGHWQLTREHDQPQGLFTLIFQKFPDGWKIISDHTSSE